MKKLKESYLEIKKSKFIGILYEVSSTSEVDDIINALKNEHKKARHIVYAYKIGSLEKNYADFAINNRKYNIKKSRDQHRTMVMLIIAFLTLFITVAYYFIRYYLTETT